MVCINSVDLSLWSRIYETHKRKNIEANFAWKIVLNSILNARGMAVQIIR